MSVQSSDPYLVLELRRDATSDQIQRAYRKLSMRWHPDQNNNSIDATERFGSICEAYDILTNRKLRALLDSQGLAALAQTYTFTKNPSRMFASFFGTDNPFSVLQGKIKKGALESAAGPPAQISILSCTLEELYTGTIKRPNVERVVVSEDGCEQRTEEVSLDVVIQAGYQSGTSITFKGKGDVLPGLPASDLTFILEQAPHSTYTRVGNDILTTASITLAQALGKHELTLRHLNGRNLLVDCNHVLTPTSKVVVQGEGFGSDGSLIIAFDIMFPTHLSSDEQDAVSRLLSKKFSKK